MPIKSSETRPQQGRGQKIKTKCPRCRTYIQSLYMKIDGKLVSVGEECPVCYEEKRKNGFNKDELEVILDAVTTIGIQTSKPEDHRFLKAIESIYMTSENNLKYK